MVLTVEIVVMQPGQQCFPALIGSSVGATVSPLSQGALDEPLGFAVGARTIRTSVGAQWELPGACGA
jgi:hypothetical protein